MKQAIKHCKKSYTVVEAYSEKTSKQIILVNGKEYTLDYLPRPAANVSDLYAVFCNGIRYSTLAKFLKSI